jgi:hypothetical protein
VDSLEFKGLLTNAREELVQILQQAQAILARPKNDFSWSSWRDAEQAIREIDGLISVIGSGALPERLDVAVLFAPTGPIQEVSPSSGWAREFLDLAARFDEVERRIYV